MHLQQTRTTRSRPIGMLRLIAAVITIAGCAGPRVEDSAPTAPEISLTEQAEAVRRGESNQIRLDRTTASDADLEHLVGLENKLQRINFSRTELTDAGLERISHMGHLMQLRLRAPHITDAGIVHLQRLKQLRHLHLIDVPLTDAGIAQLHPLVGLDSLYLDGARATDTAFGQLKKALPGAHLHVDGGHHRAGAPDSEPEHKH